MTAEVTLLGNVLRIKHGWAFKGEYFADEGDKLVLTPGNFRVGGGIQIRVGKERYYRGPYPSEFLLAEGDLLVAMTDLTQGAPILGSPLRVPAGARFLHNQRLGKVVDIDQRRLIPEFAYWLFLWDGVRAQLRASATGSTVRHTAPERIYRVSVVLPSTEAQHKIAAILSAYDDLIQNNSRRMRLLEEMAQRTYREWFVDFRYPRCNDEPLVHTEHGPIPQGWSWETLSANDLPWTMLKPQVQPYEGSRKYLATADVVGLHEITGGVDLRYSALPTRAQHQPLPGSIWFGRMAGYQKILLFPPNSSADHKYVLSSGFLCLSVQDADWWPYLAMAVANGGFESRKAIYATGATQVALTDEAARDMPWLVPPSEVARSFGLLTGSNLEGILSLREANANLRATRDLLLPRLLSGAIDVADLGIPLPEAVA